MEGVLPMWQMGIYSQCDRWGYTPNVTDGGVLSMWISAGTLYAQRFNFPYWGWLMGYTGISGLISPIGAGWWGIQVSAVGFPLLGLADGGIQVSAVGFPLLGLADGVYRYQRLDFPYWGWLMGYTGISGLISPIEAGWWGIQVSAV